MEFKKEEKKTIREKKMFLSRRKKKFLRVFVTRIKRCRSVAGLVIQASGSLVDVDIPELSESPWPGIDIFGTSMELGWRIVKELDLKLTLGMAERR